MTDQEIDQIVTNNPKLANKREQLQAMAPGAHCLHRSWGFGKIESFNAETGKLVINFDDKPGHSMDPAFCVDKLDILPEAHILVRQHAEPEAIAELVKNKPADIIEIILTANGKGAATAAEIETVLMKLIGETGYKRWWTKTKKLIAKDPRIAAPEKKHEPYILRDEPVRPEQEILEDYYFNQNPLQKIQLAEKLYQMADDVSEIQEDLPKIHETLTAAIQQTKQLSPAQQLHGIWVRNDLARTLEADRILEDNGGEEPDNFEEKIEEAVDALEPTSRSVVLEAESQLGELAENLPASYYKRFLDLLTRVHPDQWKNIQLDLLKMSQGKFTQECVNFLIERGEEELVAESLQRWLDEQNLRAPMLQWIVKNRSSRKFANIVEGLIGPRLLGAIFSAIDAEALKLNTARRIPLADVLSDDAKLISDLLNEASEENAQDLAQALLMNQGFEDLTKKSLLARFIKQFPKVQTLVSGEASSKVVTDSLVVSQESLDKRKAELEEIVQVKIPENKEAIAIAREHGDLKENSEYKMARQDQDTLLARKGLLESDMENARVTQFENAEDGVVSIGSVVVLESESGAAQTFSILGAWDSDPDNNIISYKTPLAQSLMGLKTGESVALDLSGSEATWTLKAITRWADQAVTA